MYKNDTIFVIYFVEFSTYHLRFLNSVKTREIPKFTQGGMVFIWLSAAIISRKESDGVEGSR